MAAPPLASLADGELHAPTLSAEEVDFFQQWGYLRLGPVAPPEHIEALRERIDDIMLGNVRYDDRMMMQLCPSASHLPQFEEFGATQSREFKGPTLNYRKIQDLDLDDVYRAYICSPLFEDVCRHLVGGGSPVPTSVVRSMFFSKPANGGVTIDWHQVRRLAPRPAPRPGAEMLVAAGCRRGRAALGHGVDRPGLDDGRKRCAADRTGLAQARPAADAAVERRPQEHDLREHPRAAGLA